MKNKKNIIAILLCCILMLGVFTGCGNKEEPAAAPDVKLPEWSSELSEEGVAALKTILSNGKLVLGTSADYPPFEFHTEVEGVDTILGFDVAIAQFIADKIGVELEITDMSFDNLLISLNKGDFDVVIASLGATEEREKAVDFSEPYYIPNNVAVVAADKAGEYSVKEDLIGHIVAAQKGTTCVERAAAIVGEENVVQLVKLQDLMSELLNGKVDVVICDDAVGMGYDAMYDELVALDLGITTDNSPICIAIKNNNTGLVEIVNYMLAQISQDTLDSWLADAQVLAGIE